MLGSLRKRRGRLPRLGGLGQLVWISSVRRRGHDVVAAALRIEVCSARKGPIVLLGCGSSRHHHRRSNRLLPRALIF